MEYPNGEKMTEIFRNSQYPWRLLLSRFRMRRKRSHRRRRSHQRFSEKCSRWRKLLLKLWVDATEQQIQKSSGSPANVRILQKLLNERAVLANGSEPVFQWMLQDACEFTHNTLGMLWKKIWKGQKRSFAILFVYKLGLYIIYYI